MKLLVDNQLPSALARLLSANGFECQHVLDIGLDAASDQIIWEYAKKEDLVIVTKDEDFAQLADRQTTIPPQVLWVRLGVPQSCLTESICRRSRNNCRKGMR